jgi:hypothetical protein
MRRLALVVALTALHPALTWAQSSQFGVRGLGIPVRPLSPRAIGAGGALGLFDFESSANPAALGSVTQFTSLLTSVQNFRRSTNAFGTSSGYDNRFPQIAVMGPIGGTNLAAGVSASGYTDRSFVLGTRDTIELRGAPVGVFDTLSSRGGLTDIRVAGGWRVSQTFQLGLGLHAITGSTRIQNSLHFADSTYAPAVESAEISYLGVGVSGGFSLRLVPRFTIAGTYRNDGHLNVDRDTTRIARTDLPVTIALGMRWLPSEKVIWAAGYQRRTWGVADRDIKQQRGIGANDTYELSTGIEVVRDPKNAGHRPWRLGAHYSTLPFPVTAGRQAHELGFSAGTGIRFTQGRGGVDLALQQIFRSDGAGFKERATLLTLGILIRP